MSVAITTCPDVRRWLQMGLAAAGAGATLWVMAIAGPQVTVAGADSTDAATTSSSAPDSDRPADDGVAQPSDDPEPDDDRPAPDATSADDPDDEDNGDDRAEPDTGDTDSARAVHGLRSTSREATAEPDRDTQTAPETQTGQAVSAAMQPDSPTRSWQSPYQRWVARSLEAWTADSLSWINALPTSDRTKEQLEASFFTIRRTFFNQAPTIDPVQISGVLDGPITGTLNAHDPDGDRLLYVLTRGPKSGTVHINRDGTFTYTPGGGFDGVDAFRVTAVDVGLHTNLLEPLRPIGSNPLSSLINQRAVTFAFNYTDGAEYWTPERRDALQSAAEALLLYFRVRNPVVLDYDVEGEDDRGPLSSLASAGSELVDDAPGYWNTVVQHKLLTGVDTNGAEADGEITWNFAYRWGLGATVGGLDFDFESTAMHELLHSFGFLTMAAVGRGPEHRNWMTLDRHLVTADGRRPIGRNLRWDSVYDGNLVGENGGLYFGGAHAVAAYGGYVPMYTPNPWDEAGSVAHTDDVTFAGAGQLLMNAATGPGPGIRVLSGIEIGMLRDLGYTVVALNVL